MLQLSQPELCPFYVHDWFSKGSVFDSREEIKSYLPTEVVVRSFVQDPLIHTYAVQLQHHLLLSRLVYPASKQVYGQSQIHSIIYQ